MYILEDLLEDMLVDFLSHIEEDNEKKEIDFSTYDLEAEFNSMIQERISNFIGIVDWEATKEGIVTGERVFDVSEIKRIIAAQRNYIKIRSETNEESIKYIKWLEEQINQIQGH